MSAVRVKSTRKVATVVSPSLETIVSRGTMTADSQDGAVIAAIADTASNARIHIPSGYLPSSTSDPTGTPPEFSGMVPVKVNLSNETLAAYYQGAWQTIIGDGEIDGGTPISTYELDDEIDGGTP